MPIYRMPIYTVCLTYFLTSYAHRQMWFLQSLTVIWVQPHLITLHSETGPYIRTNFKRSLWTGPKLSFTHPTLITHMTLNDCNCCNMLQCTVLNCLQWDQTSSAVSKLTRRINEKWTMALRCLSLKSLHCIVSLMTRNEAAKPCTGTRCSIMQRQKDAP